MATVANKALLQQLRPEIDAALALIAKAHGLKSLRLGNGKFNPSSGSFDFKLNGEVAGALGDGGARYLQLAGLLGLPAFGTEIVFGGRSYKTSGVNTTGTKVLCDRDGKTFLLPVDAVKAISAARMA